MQRQPFYKCHGIEDEGIPPCNVYSRRRCLLNLAKLMLLLRAISSTDVSQYLVKIPQVSNRVLVDNGPGLTHQTVFQLLTFGGKGPVIGPGNKLKSPQELLPRPLPIILPATPGIVLRAFIP